MVRSVREGRSQEDNALTLCLIIIIIILSFDIAPFPYKHAQRRITFIVRG